MGPWVHTCHRHLDITDVRVLKFSKCLSSGRNASLRFTHLKGLKHGCDPVVSTQWFFPVLLVASEAKGLGQRQIKRHVIHPLPLLRLRLGYWITQSWLVSSSLVPQSPAGPIYQLSGLFLLWMSEDNAVHAIANPWYLTYLHYYSPLRKWLMAFGSDGRKGGCTTNYTQTVGKALSLQGDMEAARFPDNVISSKQNHFLNSLCFI